MNMEHMVTRLERVASSTQDICTSTSPCSVTIKGASRASRLSCTLEVAFYHLAIFASQQKFLLK